MGFEKLENSPLSSSVYKLVVPGSGSHQLHMLKPGVAEKLQAQFQQENKPWQFYQLKFCMLHHVNACLIFEKSDQGTIFSLFDSKTMLTNLHIFQDYLSTLAKESPSSLRDIKNLAIPFVVLSASGEQVYTGMSESFAKIKLINTKVLSVDLDKVLEGEYSDVIEIEFPVGFAKPLQVAKSYNSDLKTKLCNFGFPSQTQDRKNWKAQDSDGHGFYKSCGINFGFKEKSKRTEEAASYPENLIGLLDQIFVFSDADVVRGNSGGPILNEKGEVVAILSSVMKAKDQASITVGINLLNLQEIVSHWVK